jgi:hypothetical protein
MAAKKFLRLIAGRITEVLGVQSSAGAANAGDIPALDDTGRLSQSMMPVGVVPETAQITASEALADGDFVNVWNDNGVAKVRKSDATVAGKECDGFVLAAFSSGVDATVFFEGTNTHVSGQTPGSVFLQTTAGQGGATVPSTSGNVVQRLGTAVSTTAVNFERGTSVTLA